MSLGRLWLLTAGNAMSECRILRSSTGLKRQKKPSSSNTLRTIQSCLECDVFSTLPRALANPTAHWWSQSTRTFFFPDLHVSPCSLQFATQDWVNMLRTQQCTLGQRQASKLLVWMPIDHIVGKNLVRLNWMFCQRMQVLMACIKQNFTRSTSLFR